MIRSITESVSRILAGLSAAVVLIMPIAIIADVLSRTFFNHPFAAVFEGTEYSIVWIPLLATPFITLANEHIVVDLVDGLFAKKQGEMLRNALMVIGAAVSLIAMVMLAIMAWDAIVSAFDQGTLMTTTLRPPRWIIHSIIPISVTLAALAFAILLGSGITRLITKNKRGDTELHEAKG